MPRDEIAPSEVSAFLSKRVEIERDLGRQSFVDFYRMAWPVLDPEPYSAGNHIRVICYHLQLAARRDIQQLLVCIPPRHSKSLLCSVAFPAWVWTWWPSAKFITCSYDQTLATRDALASRRLVESPWYQQRWPEVRFQADQNQKTYYETTAGGLRFVGSPGAGVTGHGSDFSLFDDPHDITRGESETTRNRARTFWFETMSGRFNNPMRGVSIVVQQRVHAADVASECIKRGYHTVVLPARFEPEHPQRHRFDWRTKVGEVLWPEKFTETVLERLWRTLGGDQSYAVAGQQQQRPVPREGGLFKRPWFKMLETLPAPIVWVRAWDWAATEADGASDPDWTAGVKLGLHRETGQYIVGNVVRARVDPAGLERMLINTAQQDGKDVAIFLPQDAAAAGKVMLSYQIKQLAGFVVKFGTMAGSKQVRSMPFATQAAAGNVALYRADWNDDFLDELTQFPNGRHDDQVDAVACAFNMFIEQTTGLLDWFAAQAQDVQSADDRLREAMGITSVVRDYQWERR